MPEPTIANIRQTLDARLQPTITLWNRLEGRPRTHDFERALRAEVRDPVWMLTRQWQMGEFNGADAGSPVFAKVHIETERLEGFQPGAGAVEPFDYGVPLEAQVEQRPIPFRIEGQPVSLDIRLLMGRHWLKLMRPVGDFRDEFIGLYSIAVPDPGSRADAAVCADTETWQHAAAVAGRALDGHQLYVHLKGGGAAHDGTSIPAADHVEVDRLARRFVDWFERLYYQPADDHDAWQPDSLDYNFAVSAPDSLGGGVLIADSYHHGRLDWYNLDIDPDRTTLGAAAVGTPPGDPPRPTTSFIPVPASFDGMPNTRWWAFEDSRTNLGDVNPGTKDLAKLMLLEFGLIYGNDWFVFPLTLPVGSTTRIRGLAVTNVFGERTWIEAAGRGPDEAWQRWSMYTLAVAGPGAAEADMRFLLPPSVPKIQEGEPREEVALIRDEMANMVWGIEARVALPHGRSRPGYEAAMDTQRFLERLVGAAPGDEPPPAAAPVRYTVMSNNVPGHWIPFIPVHVPGDNRQVQLQRAALPRVIPRDPLPPVKIRPRTALLGVGRERDEAYFVHEEEVPRAGVHVAQSFQRTRWFDGRVVTWLGVHKQTGRGEGSSHLRFDYLAPAVES